MICTKLYTQLHEFKKYENETSWGKYHFENMTDTWAAKNFLEVLNRTGNTILCPKTRTQQHTEFKNQK